MTKTLGIIAGGGDLPGRIIEACKKRGRPYFVIAIEGQADPEIIAENPHSWLRLGAAKKALEIARREECDEIVMVGPIKRPSITALRPDMLAAQVLARAGTSSIMGDDGLLKAVIAQIEEFGFTVVGPESFLEDQRHICGVLGRYEPDNLANSDILRGVHVLTHLGPADVGQSVVVQDNLVIAVEAVEGTDAMIKRSKNLLREGPSGILIKLPKPGQETRADLPTVGPSTVEHMKHAGLRGLTIDAQNTLIVDREVMIRSADEAEIFILAIDSEKWASDLR